MEGRVSPKESFRTSRPDQSGHDEARPSNDVKG